MTIPGKVLIAILSACLVSFIATLVIPGSSWVHLAAVSAVASLLAVLVSHKPLASPPAAVESAAPARQRDNAGSDGKRARNRPDRERGGDKSQRDRKPAPADRSAGDGAKETARDVAKKGSSPGTESGPREQGTVKWFNGSKGFGFVIRENGEEIFVHYRSIRGEGRRSLRDGQAVTFRVDHTDKGPQAEDVEGLD